MTEHQQPAGWYASPDPERRSRFARYWDGERWTSHEIPIEASSDAPVRGAGPTQPTPGADGDSADASAWEDEPRRGGVTRRLAQVTRFAIVVTVAVLASLFVIDSLDADGPIGYSLRSEATTINPLVNAPQLRVTAGQQTHDVRMSQTGGGVARIVGATWSLDEPVTIEFIPAFPNEEGHTFVVDLREDGASALNQDWFLRVDIVATNSTFEIEVSQPVSSGFVRRREATHRVTLPRSNERMLIEALEAQREREAATRRAADQARQAARQARTECVREESAAAWTAVTPVTGLNTLLQDALTRRRIYGGESVTFEEYRRRITNLTNDMQSHLRDADQVLKSGLAPTTGEFEVLVQEYTLLRQAWLDFERALRSPRTTPADSLAQLYPVEWRAIELWDGRIPSSVRAASTAAYGTINLAANAVCDSRHPLP